MAVLKGGGLAGKPAGGWYGTAPGWVDLKKPAGATSQEKSGYDAPGWWIGYLQMGLTLIYTPNLVWLLMSLFAYFAIPYDFDAAREWRLSMVVSRAALNLGLMYAYYGFWHYGMYCNAWSIRKFNAETNGPTLAELFHNIWYASLATLQWTAWEVCMLRLYATGRASYVDDFNAFATPTGLLQTIALVVLVPFFRELHGYFCHRLIHFRALYRYVHSVHHRNTDPEPFSGICMHPIEVFYYLSCSAAVLSFSCSPFIMTWIGLHALISPACSHSGFEDHWNCDQFHYFHHAKFDINFGHTSVPFDKWFGTYRETIIKEPAEGNALKKEPKHTYLTGGLYPSWGLPNSWDHAAYHISYCAIFALFANAIVNGGSSDVERHVLAALFAAGPVAAALLLCVAVGDSMTWRWPFVKEKVAGAAGFHLVVGVLLCVLPIWRAASLLLAPSPLDVFEKADPAYDPFNGGSNHSDNRDGKSPTTLNSFLLCLILRSGESQ